MRLTSLGSWARFNTWVGIHWLSKELTGEVPLNPLEVKCVEKLDGENKLLQLHLTVSTLEDPRPASHGQIRVLIGQIGSLHRNVTVVSEVEAVDGLITITFLSWFVFDQNAYSSSYSKSFFQVPTVQLIIETTEKIQYYLKIKMTKKKSRNE
jgi:hypothetical protein